MSKIIADLHIHSTFSDGILTPKEIIDRLVRLKATHFSITDHDTCAAYRVLKKIIKDYDLTLIPGIEFSTKDDFNIGRRDIHVLGFYINVHDKKIIDYSENLLEGRRKEKLILVERLKEAKYPIKWEDVEKRANGNQIGKPHVVEPILDNMNLNGSERYVTREKLYDFCCSQNIERPGVMSIEGTINFIHELGGVAILAHPELYEADDLIIKDCISAGIDGIELYNKYRNPIYMQDSKYAFPFEKLEKYNNYALENNLLITGGSDYHGHNPSSETLTGGMDNHRLEIFINSCIKLGINTKYPI